MNTPRSIVMMPPMNMAKVKTNKTIPRTEPMRVPSNSPHANKYMKRRLLSKKQENEMTNTDKKKPNNVIEQHNIHLARITRL